MSTTVLSVHTLGAQALGTVLVVSGILKLRASGQSMYVFRIWTLAARVPRIPAALLEGVLGMDLFLELAPTYALPITAVLILVFFVIHTSSNGPCACFGPMSAGTPSRFARLLRLSFMTIALLAASEVFADPTPLVPSLPGAILGVTIGVLIIGVGEINIG